MLFVFFCSAYEFICLWNILNLDSMLQLLMMQLFCLCSTWRSGVLISFICCARYVSTLKQHTELAALFRCQTGVVLRLIVPMPWMKVVEKWFSDLGKKTDICTVATSEVKDQNWVYALWIIPSCWSSRSFLFSFFEARAEEHLLIYRLDNIDFLSRTITFVRSPTNLFIMVSLR